MENGIPASVKKARDQVYKADAVIFGVPEYNASISSPMKNTYDWLSLPFPKLEEGRENAPMKEKYAAMVSSGGQMGG